MPESQKSEQLSLLTFEEFSALLKQLVNKLVDTIHQELRHAPHNQPLTRSLDDKTRRKIPLEIAELTAVYLLQSSEDFNLDFLIDELIRFAELPRDLDSASKTHFNYLINKSRESIHEFLLIKLIDYSVEQNLAEPDYDVKARKEISVALFKQLQEIKDLIDAETEDINRKAELQQHLYDLEEIYIKQRVKMCIDSKGEHGFLKSNQRNIFALVEEVKNRMVAAPEQSKEIAKLKADVARLVEEIN